MKKATYAIYKPAEAGLPYLVVILNGKTPVQMFGYADRKKAKKLLRETKARIGAREELSADKSD
jgi:hypothetical protein